MKDISICYHQVSEKDFGKKEKVKCIKCGKMINPKLVTEDEIDKAMKIIKRAANQLIITNSIKGKNLLKTEFVLDELKKLTKKYKKKVCQPYKIANKRVEEGADKESKVVDVPKEYKHGGKGKEKAEKKRKEQELIIKEKKVEPQTRRDCMPYTLDADGNKQYVDTIISPSSMIRRIASEDEIDKLIHSNEVLEEIKNDSNGKNLKKTTELTSEEVQEPNRDEVLSNRKNFIERAVSEEEIKNIVKPTRRE